MRLVTIQAITSNYTDILRWLESGEERKRKEKNGNGVKTCGFFKSLTKFNSFFLLEILRMVFTIVEGGSSTLQGIQLSFGKSEKTITCIRQSVSNARADARFVCIWQSILDDVG